jgi:hypothetical protein
MRSMKKFRVTVRKEKLGFGSLEVFRMREWRE